MSHEKNVTDLRKGPGPPHTSNSMNLEDHNLVFK